MRHRQRTGGAGVWRGSESSGQQQKSQCQIPTFMLPSVRTYRASVHRSMAEGAHHTDLVTQVDGPVVTEVTKVLLHSISAAPWWLKTLTNEWVV
jgi:hypothetical protein